MDPRTLGELLAAFFVGAALGAVLGNATTQARGARIGATVSSGVLIAYWLCVLSYLVLSSAAVFFRIRLRPLEVRPRVVPV